MSKKKAAVPNTRAAAKVKPTTTTPAEQKLLLDLKEARELNAHLRHRAEAQQARATDEERLRCNGFGEFIREIPKALLNFTVDDFSQYIDDEDCLNEINDLFASVYSAHAEIIRIAAEGMRRKQQHDRDDLGMRGAEHTVQVDPRDLVTVETTLRMN